MERVVALVVTLCVGGLIAFQPPANALLSRHVGDLGAAFASLALSTLIIGVLLLIAGEAGELRGLREVRPEHALGGIGGAAIVFVSLVAVRHLGAAGVAAALVSMQLVISLVIDRVGALGLREEPLTASRVSGVVLLIVGTALVTAR